MEKHLFLTGASGSGKTTLIRNALGARLAYAGGYVTERALDADGRLLGFDLLPAAAAAGIEGFDAARFLDYTHEPPTSDNEVFRGEGVRLLKEAEYYPFTVMDEFGGFELIIPQFREALLEVLNSELPCIGVLKGEQNGEELRRSLGLGEKYSNYRRTLRAALDADPDTLVVDVSGRGDENARRIVMQWASEYAV